MIILHLQIWRAMTVVAMLLMVLVSAGKALAQTTVSGSNNVGVNLMTGGNINNTNISNKFIINPTDNYIIIKNIKEIHKDNDIDIKSIDKLLNNNDYSGAIKKANSTIEKNNVEISKLAYLFYIKGLINSKQRKWDIAIQEFKKSTALAPDNCRYFSGLLLSTVMSGEYSEADKIIYYDINTIKKCGSTQEVEERYSIYNAILMRAATTKNSDLADISAKELVDTIREIINTQTSPTTEKEISTVCSINNTLAILYFNYEAIDENIKNSCINTVKKSTSDGKIFAAIFFNIDYLDKFTDRDSPKYGQIEFDKKINYLLSKKTHKDFWISSDDILTKLGWLYRDRGFWSLWNQNDSISANRDYTKAYNIFYYQGVNGIHQGYRSWSHFFSTVYFFDAKTENPIFGAKSKTIPDDAKKLLSIFVEKHQTVASCDLYLDFLERSVNLWEDKYTEVIKLYENTTNNCIKNGKFPEFESNWLNMRWHVYLSQKNSWLNGNERKKELILAKNYADKIIYGPTHVEISQTYKYIIANTILAEISNEDRSIAMDLIKNALNNTKIDRDVDLNYFILLKFSKAFIELTNSQEGSLENAIKLINENNASKIYDCGAASIYTSLVITAIQIQSKETNNPNFENLMGALTQIAPRANKTCLGIYINKQFMDEILLTEIFFTARFYEGEDLSTDIIKKYTIDGVSEETFNAINNATIAALKNAPKLNECSEKYNSYMKNITSSSKIKYDFFVQLHKFYANSNANCV